MAEDLHERQPHRAMAGGESRSSAGGSTSLLEPATLERVRADGKHLSAAGVPFRVKGVTYGSFLPREDGLLFPTPAVIEADLQAMARVGLNVVRTYTTPPRQLLEVAASLGMRVLLGVHYDDWRTHGVDRAVHRQVREAGLRALDEALELAVGNPTVLGLSVGNEVPGDLVRLHGVRAVEDVLSALVAHIHDADPGILATYSNFPTTEYLRIDGLDLTSFNVFLEDPERLRAYLRHLQVVAGNTPLLVTELGLAGDVHGDAAQAASIDAQLRVVEETGCAGATIFAWTDEWGVAGESVEGWGFGLTRADRSPKPAAEVARSWAGRDVRDLRDRWPALSVVVCAYNEERLLAECLTSLNRLDYPDLDVIVCDDGSTDGTLEIARRYPFRVLDLPHGGLSAARNTGAAAAHGEIVAYLDADAHCHPDWPYHLAFSLEDDGVVATGGPNLPVLGAGFVERAVAMSPGGPVEVLVTDDRAEHVPGCNMAFDRDALLAIGGFDVAYTAAGDDVDVCWKLLDAGGEIAFAPAAQVRHHRRSTVRGYLRQQRGYGRSERMVASRHAHRFNRLGQARWAGAIYGGLRMLPMVLRPIVYHGPVGGAPYQSVVADRGARLFSTVAALLPMTAPLALAGLLLARLSPGWLLLSVLAVGVLAAYAGVIAAAATPARDEPQPWRWRALVAALHVAQPFVRTWGRLRGQGLPTANPPASHPWTGDRVTWLMALARELRNQRCAVRFPGPVDGWDVEVAGVVVATRLRTAVQWGWTPCLRHRWAVRSRPAATAVTVLVGAGAAGVPTWALAVIALVVVAGDGRRLQTRIDRAVAVTTDGADVNGVAGTGLSP